MFLRRVSTENQSIAMQETADAPYREKLLPEINVNAMYGKNVYYSCQNLKTRPLKSSVN